MWSNYRDQVEFEYLPKRDRNIAWVALCGAAALLVGILVGFSVIAHAQQQTAEETVISAMRGLSSAQTLLAQIPDLLKQTQGLQQGEARLDAQLKWVLDNWVPKPPPEQK